MLSFIVPSYNEEAHIRQALMKIMAELDRLGQYELIVVEESTDRTPQIVAELAKKHQQIKHLHFSERMGKGGAIEKAIGAAAGDHIIFTDADLSTGLEAVPVIARSLKYYDVVVGSRYNPLSRSNRSLLRLLLSRTYAMCVSALLGMNRPSDLQCGMKGFRKKAAVEIIGHVRSKGFFWDTEFIFYANKLGYTIKEIPVVWVEKKVRGSGSGKLKNIFYMAKSLMKLAVRKWA